MAEIEITLVYAHSPTKQFLRQFFVEEGSTVAQAIALSGVLAAYPEIDWAINQVGIFSKVVPLTQIVKANDRIEIYRPLIFDPMSARRARAKNQLNGAESSPDVPRH
jgi:uncharacterized protein